MTVFISDLIVNPQFSRNLREIITHACGPKYSLRSESLTLLNEVEPAFGPLRLGSCSIRAKSNNPEPTRQQLFNKKELFLIASKQLSCAEIRRDLLSFSYLAEKHSQAKSLI